MVVNLCLPQFHTAIHCNKLCADGYDVTNLVSADPTMRRRGFKLEYFLRPPLQVTLTFKFKVELCRVDVELWPWGMDRGQACKKLEISTCSGSLSSASCDQNQQDRTQDHPQRKVGKDGNLSQNSGGVWRERAQSWSANEPQCTTNQSYGDFKLVGRCELREETRVCFSHKYFKPRPPFQHPPPSPPPTNCRHDELWSRGPQSLGAVTQLRVALPFGGAASALGLKALSVWGQPAKCCTAEEVERIRNAHEASERLTQTPVSVTPVCPTKLQQRTPTSQSSEVPEEFLDPITQEVMVLPMLLPSGVSVDHSTLEEYQKREATWGRPPNDPFTGVPFTVSSQPLPHPQLKARIDHFFLQRGQLSKDGRLGRQAEVRTPHPSRLVVTERAKRTCSTEQTEIKALKLNTCTNDVSEDCQESLLPQAKRPRNAQVSEATCTSHEQRLSASLDEALSSALQGRPSFTSNLSLNQPQHTEVKAATSKGALCNCSVGGFDTCLSPWRSHCFPWNVPLYGIKHIHLLRNKQVTAPGHVTDQNCGDEKICSACSCSLSVYSTPVSVFYRLTCGHFLCRSCLHAPSKPPDPKSTPTSRYVSCATCHSSTPRSDVTRVHH